MDHYEAYRQKILNNTLTNSDMRSELARRIRSARYVSVVNDPARSCRKQALECMKTGRGHNRLYGVPKVAKDNRI